MNTPIDVATAIKEIKDKLSQVENIRGAKTLHINAYRCIEKLLLYYDLEDEETLATLNDLLNKKPHWLDELKHERKTFLN